MPHSFGSEFRNSVDPLFAGSGASHSHLARNCGFANEHERARCQPGRRLLGGLYEPPSPEVLCPLCQAATFSVSLERRRGLSVGGVNAASDSFVAAHPGISSNVSLAVVRGKDFPHVGRGIPQFGTFFKEEVQASSHGTSLRRVSVDCIIRHFPLGLGRFGGGFYVRLRDRTPVCCPQVDRDVVGGAGFLGTAQAQDGVEDDQQVGMPFVLYALGILFQFSNLVPDRLVGDANVFVHHGEKFLPDIRACEIKLADPVAGVLFVLLKHVVGNVVGLQKSLRS